ncbi:hypothetical protein ABT001_21435 [Streptomyces sp. NPDC002793]|uniref:hypothetical protein n=1 Tax=Streptomyces sp. NPDC002793 TaxID=3154432 RepID=UPI003324D921
MDRLPRSSALVAATLFASLALTACGGDEPAAEKAGGAGPETARSTPPAAGGEGGESGGAAAKALEGTWTGTSGDVPVVLSVTSGKVALAAGQHICQGEVKGTGRATLALKCLDGNTDRTTGTVESNDGDTLVIAWNAGAEDSLARTDASTLPTGPPEVPAL